MRTAWLLVGLSLATLSLATRAPAQRRPANSIVAGDLGKRLETAALANSKYVWGTVLVAHESKPVFAWSFGALDRKGAKRGRKLKAMSTKALFDLGGASQSLAHLLALRLEATGKLQLSDPIGKHLGDWPADKRGITVQDLMRHTSGLPEEVKWPNGVAKDSRATARLLGQARLAHPPGGKFLYSTLNATLLALVLEQVGGRYDKALASTVLKPFGMKGANHCGSSVSNRLETMRRKPMGDEKATALNYNWRYRGASGILASVHDVHELLANATAGELLDARLRDLWWRPLAGGAFAVRETDAGGQKLRVFEGRTPGYRTRWTLHERSRSWVVICAGKATNIDALESALLSELARELTPGAVAGGAAAKPPTPAPGARTPAPPPGGTSAGAVGASDAARFVGIFELPTGGRLQIVSLGGKLRLIGEGLQGSVRVAQGGFAADPVATRQADRGIALLERLVRGDASAVDDAFRDAASATAITAALAGFVTANGEFERVAFVGNPKAGAANSRRPSKESWFRVDCARGSRYVIVRWRDERRFASCKLSADEPPFAAELQVIAPDTAVARTAAGRPVRITMEGRGNARTLVFEDATPGDAGLIDCVEVAR
ncbi:MAG: beta-lactamase family protein [bacterium]|nr:beta-lactamase family protein [bacterium]